MNIALVSREFPPFYGGGIGTYTEQAAHALADAGHRVVVLTVSRDGSSARAPHERDTRVTVVRVPLVVGDDWSMPAPAIDSPETRAAFADLGPWSAFSRQVAAVLPSLVSELSIDVVEAPECGAILWWTLNERRLGRSRLVKPDGSEPLLVVHLHSPNQWVDEHNRQAPPVRASIELRAAERESARLADLVIAPSKDLGAWAASEWGLRAVHVVPYPLGFIRAAAREPARSADAPLRCLLVGRMEPRKGVDVLLAAIGIAARKGVDVRAELAGQDTRDWRTGAWFARRAANTLLAPGLRDRVTLLGKLDSAALSAARSRADICVAPGVVDNFPYAVVESMAAGLPVIAPSIGGMSELVRDQVDGHIFRPHDPSSLADALMAHAALAPGARAEMARAAVARVASFCGNERAVSMRQELFTRSRDTKQTPQTARAPGAEVTVIGGRGEALADIVRAGVCDFAIGWERDPDGRVIARSTPNPITSSIAPAVRGPVAVRSDLLRSILLECDGAEEEGGGSVDIDPDTLVRLLLERDARGVVDPHQVSAVVGDALPANEEDSPLLLHPATFVEIVPLRMARRRHPYPWDVVPVAGLGMPPS